MNLMTNGEAEQYLPPWVEKKKYELLGVGQGRGTDNSQNLSKTPFKKFNAQYHISMKIRLEAYFE